MTEEPKPDAKIAIVGWAKEGLEALSLPSDWELWGFNDPDESFGPNDADRWFQLHSFPYLKEHWPMWEAYSKPYWQHYWRRGGKCPLYVQDTSLDLVLSERFPKERVEQELPRGRYHCGTFDWLVAFALLFNPKAIRVYGVALSYNGEPFSARACLEYWLGVAEGRGIETWTNSKDLFRAHQIVRSNRQYAWDESRPVLDLEEGGIRGGKPPRVKGKRGLTSL